MEKIGLLIDTTSYTRDDLLNRSIIKAAPLGVSIDGVLYKEPDLSFETMMKYLSEGRKMMTSQPSPGEFLHLYEAYYKEGYTHIFVVALSEKVSGTYQSAVLAKSLVDFPITISVHSPKVASFGVALGLPILAEAIEKGISFDALEALYTKTYANAHVMFTLSNLMHLFRGGRLSRVAALLGTVLRIKPVIEMIDGKLELTRKERTNNQCFDYFMETIKKYHDKYQTIRLDIIQLQRPEWAEKIKEAVEEMYPNISIHMTNYISPVFSVHLGDQGFGIAILGE